MRLTPLSLCFLVACSSDTAPVQSSPLAAVPAAMFVSSAPAGARAIDEIKREAKSGDEVVVRAQIGGRKRWAVDGLAVFLVVDPDLRSCDEIDGDDCPTPWDFCCEAKEKVTAQMATVRIVGADGEPIPGSLAGVSGLEPLAHLVVRGRVHSNSDGNLVIDAQAIHMP